MVGKVDAQAPAFPSLISHSACRLLLLYVVTDGPRLNMRAERLGHKFGSKYLSAPIVPTTAAAVADNDDESTKPNS